MKITEKIVNAITQEETIIERDATDLEITERAEANARAETAQAEANALTAKRQAIANKLGLSADELNTLLS